MEYLSTYNNEEIRRRRKKKREVPIDWCIGENSRSFETDHLRRRST